MTWKCWYSERPTDHKQTYRWRLGKPRLICNKLIQPEWSGKLELCGMGYGDSEHWPEGSSWDGWKRTVPKELEWRPMIEGESEETIFHGLNLLPSPFTGLPPQVELYDSYVGAGAWVGRQMAIKSWMVNSVGWYDANKMEDAWNRRSG